MPANQIASTANFDFGAPVALGTVLLFKVKDHRGGKLNLRFENPDGRAAVAVTVQVAPSDAIAAGDAEVPDTFANTSAANNGAAIVGLSVGQRQSREATIFLRSGLDQWLRVQASGGARAALQIRGDAILEPVTI